MASNSSSGISEQLRANRSSEEDLEARLPDYRNRTDPFLVICGCFSFLTIVSSLLCATVDVISAVYSFKNGENIFDGILRCYAAAIALFVAIAQTEWERILKFWQVLDYWVGRGMLQIFVAVMTKALSESTEKDAMIILQDIASYMMLACGFIYVISGLLCCGSLKRARMKKAISREQAAKEIEELEKRREELHGLLRSRD